MPPRYSYWTIIADGLPTAFRAAERDELAPTFQRLKERHPDAEMKWFARGKLWDSPDAARRAEDHGRHEERGRSWRPGGEHRDPRQKFKDAKKSRNAAQRQQRFERKHGSAPGNRGGGTAGRPASGWRPRDDARGETLRPHASGDRRKPFSKRSADGRKPFPGDRPFTPGSSGPRKPHGDKFRPRTDGQRPFSSREREPDRNRTGGASRPPRASWRDDRAPREKPHGDKLRPRTGSDRAFGARNRGGDREPPADVRFRDRDTRPPREKPHGAPQHPGRRPPGGGTRPFPSRGFQRERDRFGDRPSVRNQGTEEPSPPPRPRGPNREPRPSEAPEPTAPPRPSEPVVPPPGPPERGFMAKHRKPR